MTECSHKSEPLAPTTCGERPTCQDSSSSSSDSEPREPNSEPKVERLTCQDSPPSSSDSEPRDPNSKPKVERLTCENSLPSCSHSEPRDPNSEPKVETLKAPRPFKAYLKDRLELGEYYRNSRWPSNSSSDSYKEFRDRILSKVPNYNSGTNEKMRRTPQFNHNRNKDPEYLEKRRKNNEAAKKSREARRAKEDEIAIRCAYFERENNQLHYTIKSLNKELEQLRQVIYLAGLKKS